MGVELLTDHEKRILLQAARRALEDGVRGRLPGAPDASILTPALRAQGASFVTLTIDGALRGCVGALEAYQPLVEDVREHALAAALRDFRFPPVIEPELDGIRIEVSRLTAPVVLEYASAEELAARLRPHVDGVILRDGPSRATYLPQVWNKLATPADFLDSLCEKMGAEAGLWRRKILTVQVYQVEEFYEHDGRLNGEPVMQVK